MKREDVLNVDAVKEELTLAIQQMNHSMVSVFGQLVYALDTVIDRYTDLEAKHIDLQRRFDDLHQRFGVLEANDATVTARLLRLERHLGDAK